MRASVLTVPRALVLCNAKRVLVPGPSSPSTCLNVRRRYGNIAHGPGDRLYSMYNMNLNNVTTLPNGTPLGRTGTCFRYLHPYQPLDRAASVKPSFVLSVAVLGDAERVCGGADELGFFVMKYR